MCLHQTAMGCHDLNKLKGNLEIKITKGNEKYTPLGKKDPVRVEKGRYACMDDKKIICWLNALQCEETKTTLDSKDIIIYLEGNENTSDDYLDKWIRKVAEAIVKFNGGEYQIIR